jgi:transcriptional regulator with XRE-family HTH domain
MDRMGAEHAVRELLAASGMTKSALCAAAGVSRSSLDEYLKGERQPSLRQLERLGEAAGLRVDISWRPAERTDPSWLIPDNPSMKATPLTVRERAQVLEVVVATAVELQRRPRGPLTATPFRQIRRHRESTLPA